MGNNYFLYFFRLATLVTNIYMCPRNIKSSWYGLIILPCLLVRLIRRDRTDFGAVTAQCGRLHPPRGTSSFIIIIILLFMIKMTELNQGFITHNLYTNVAISHAYYTLTCDFQSSSYSFRKVALIFVHPGTAVP